MAAKVWMIINENGESKPHSGKIMVEIKQERKAKPRSGDSTVSKNTIILICVTATRLKNKRTPIYYHTIGATHLKAA
jgi:hypothetical protein